MTKKIVALTLMLLTLLAVGCDKRKENTQIDEKLAASENFNAENGGIKNKHLTLADGEVVFRAKVTSTENTKFLEVEIIDSEIAFGTYHVLLSDTTTYFDSNGNKIKRTDIKDGSVIEIVFSGQVMNSYPPKIAGRKIYLV